MKVRGLTKKYLKFSIKKLKSEIFSWGFAPDLTHRFAVNIHSLAVRLILYVYCSKMLRISEQKRVINFCWCFAPDIVVIICHRHMALVPPVSYKSKSLAGQLFVLSKLKHLTKSVFKFLEFLNVRSKIFAGALPQTQPQTLYH